MKYFFLNRSKILFCFACHLLTNFVMVASLGRTSLDQLQSWRCISHWSCCRGGHVIQEWPYRALCTSGFWGCFGMSMCPRPCLAEQEVRISLEMAWYLTRIVVVWKPNTTSSHLARRGEITGQRMEITYRENRSQMENTRPFLVCGTGYQTQGLSTC